MRRELLDGNAEMPGVVDIMRAMSSDCNLNKIIWSQSPRAAPRFITTARSGLDLPFGNALGILPSRRRRELAGVLHTGNIRGRVLGVLHNVIHNFESASLSEGRRADLRTKR